MARVEGDPKDHISDTIVDHQGHHTSHVRVFLGGDGSAAWSEAQQKAEGKKSEKGKTLAQTLNEGEGSQTPNTFLTIDEDADRPCPSKAES